MKKLFILICVLLLGVSVSFAETVSTKITTLDPQEIMLTWTQEGDSTPAGNLRCFPLAPSPDGKTMLHVHREKFINPDKTAQPAAVIMMFDADTNQVYSVLWEENGAPVVFIRCGDNFRRYPGSGPACPPSTKT